MKQKIVTVLNVVFKLAFIVAVFFSVDDLLNHNSASMFSLVVLVLGVVMWAVWSFHISSEQKRQQEYERAHLIFAFDKFYNDVIDGTVPCSEYQFMLDYNMGQDTFQRIIVAPGISSSMEEYRDQHPVS